MSMSNSNGFSFHKKLKKSIEELHTKTNKIPYINQLMKNDIPLISYIGHLRALAIIYGTLESYIDNYKDEKLIPFLNGYKPKLPLILADLEHFKAAEHKTILPAINQAMGIADKIMLYNVNSPYKLLGYIYTLEGSINGGKILRKNFIEAFDLKNNDGVNYFSSYDENFIVFWENFKEKLSKISDEVNQKEVLESSTEIFNELLNIFHTLYPLKENELSDHITSFNPEAGNHTLPDDPKEINAAITAAIICWNEFPYYEKRYGGRGKRFAFSDSLWLVTLCELTFNEALKQILWLSNFLAIRGMPTYLMEFQLKVLYEELIKAKTTSVERYSNILKIEYYFRKHREIYFNESFFENCNSFFEKNYNLNKIDNDLCNILKKNIGILIASSIIDDKSNIPDALSSFKDWITNNEVFPDKWILAVEKTYTEIESNLNPILIE